MKDKAITMTKYKSMPVTLILVMKIANNVSNHIPIKINGQIMDKSFSGHQKA